MDHNWYYAEGDKSVGPLTLADMTAILSRVPNARNVLVWQDGFSSWLKVQDVPELAQHVIKPPPIPVSAKPPPIPVSVPRLRQSASPAPTSPTVTGEVRTKYEPSETNKKDLVGIGGWLILVAIGQVLGPLKFTAFLFNYYTSLDDNFWTKFPIACYGEAFLNVSVLAIACYTSYLFFTKSKLFPTFFVYEYAAFIL
jgi:hypothetical protein